MIVHFIARLKNWARHTWQQLQACVLGWTEPISSAVVGLLQDPARIKTELILGNAGLRQQLIMLNLAMKRPVLKGRDRRLVVLLDSKLQTWKQALLIIQPETLLRWHRELFRWVWRRKSKPKGQRHPLSAALIALIKRLVIENQLWGAERIRGELLKLGIRVRKRTNQKYACRSSDHRPANKPGPPSRTTIRRSRGLVIFCNSRTFGFGTYSRSSF